MIVTHVRQARPDWYDRNPTTVGLNYFASGVAPHGSTQRWTYTVPSGKKTLVETSISLINRVTVAAPAARASANVSCDTLDSSTCILTAAENIGNAINDGYALTSGGNVILNQADVLSAYTLDTSTGGTQTYRAAAKLTEFDA